MQGGPHGDETIDAILNRHLGYIPPSATASPHMQGGPQGAGGGSRGAGAGIGTTTRPPSRPSISGPRSSDNQQRIAEEIVGGRTKEEVQTAIETGDPNAANLINQYLFGDDPTVPYTQPGGSGVPGPALGIDTTPPQPQPHQNYTQPGGYNPGYDPGFVPNQITPSPHMQGGPQGGGGYNPGLDPGLPNQITPSPHQQGGPQGGGGYNPGLDPGSAREILGARDNQRRRAGGAQPAPQTPPADPLIEQLLARFPRPPRLVALDGLGHHSAGNERVPGV